MRKIILASASLCAALVIIAGGAPARSAAQTTAAQKKRVDAGAEAAKQKPASKPSPAKPQVRVIDEAGLKALMDESAKKGQRLLVNFWATWCVPCREEFPDLVKIDEEFEGRDDFEFITVSLDDISELDKNVPDFLSEMSAARMPAYLLDAKDPEAVIALVDKTWRGELPATFLFGRGGGELLFRHTGRVEPVELRKAITDSNAGAAAGSDDK